MTVDQFHARADRLAFVMFTVHPALERFGLPLELDDQVADLVDAGHDLTEAIEAAAAEHRRTALVDVIEEWLRNVDDAYSTYNRMAAEVGLTPFQTERTRQLHVDYRRRQLARRRRNRR